MKIDLQLSFYKSERYRELGELILESKLESQQLSSKGT